MLSKGQATAQHAAHFVQLAQIAGSDLLTELFGNRAEAVFTSAYLGEKNEHSHRYTQFLLAEGEIAGMTQGIRGAEARQVAGRTFLLMLFHARGQVFRFLIKTALLENILSFMSQRAADDFYINFVAIYSQFRGRGYSKDLLAAAEQMARAQDCARLALDVDEGNTVARAVYTSAGFAVVGASQPARFANESFRVLRLEKPLPSASYAPPGSSEVKYSRTTSRMPSGT